MKNITIRTADWDADQSELSAIRKTVFVDEQQVPVELEWDNLDQSALHWLAITDAGKAVGTLRLLPSGQVGRMAVLAEYRGHGIGRALLESCISYAKQQDLFDLVLHAQIQAQAFYETSGFVAQGPTYMEAGIPHVDMRLPLTDQRLLAKHGGKFAISDLTEHNLDLVRQCQRNLLILSYDLNPELYDQPSFVEVVSSLARKSRYSDIKILIQDSSRAVSAGHRLVELQRRLPTHIKLRKITDRNSKPSENFLVADGIGLIVQSVHDPDIQWGNYNNRPLAEDYQKQFEELWQHAEEDPELRKLEI
jgi:predicted GNAT family N-acyltransferase